MLEMRETLADFDSAWACTFRAGEGYALCVTLRHILQVLDDDQNTTLASKLTPKYDLIIELARVYYQSPSAKCWLSSFIVLCFGDSHVRSRVRFVTVNSL